MEQEWLDALHAAHLCQGGGEEEEEEGEEEGEGEGEGEEEEEGKKKKKKNLLTIRAVGIWIGVPHSDLLVDVLSQKVQNPQMEYSD